MTASATEPLVSVCIGTYNRERYIRETIESVLAQTYGNFEVVIVDDASTDGTLDIIRSFEDPRIRIIERTENSGVCPITRNQAARAAKGEYLAFLDSDDGWYPTKLEKQVAFMQAHPAIPLCHVYCHVIDGASRVTGIRHQGALPPTGECFSAFLKHCWPTIASIMVQRDIFDRVGGYFTEDPRYGIWGEDNEFFLRVAARYPVGCIEEVLGRYRRHSDNIAGGNWKCTPESVPFHNMIIDRTDIWKGKVPRSEVVAAFVNNCHANGQFWRDRGYGARALWFSLQALSRDPLNGTSLVELIKSLVRILIPHRQQK